ncbi:MAG: hypothetical protein ACKOHH_06025, partial [Bacteroidota bacterium]
VNGSVTAATPASIIAQPSGNLNIQEGSSTSISVTGGSAGASYQWQSLVAGGSWTAITNTAPYSGATTSTLSITGATLALNGTQYRVVVTGGCGNPLNSNAVTLSVTGANTVGFSAGNVTGCQGDTVAIPLTGTGINAVTAMSLKVNLPTGATYVGLSGISTGLSTASGSEAGGLLTITWTGAAFTLASGPLMSVRMVLPAQPGSVTWDASSSVTPNACGLKFTNSYRC